MPFYYYDLTFVFLLPALILSIFAQQRIASRYLKYAGIFSRRNMTGAEAARKLLRASGIIDVEVEEIGAKKTAETFFNFSEAKKELAPRDQRHLTELLDHYDPRSRTIRLSRHVYEGNSISALAIAAHEAGHAIQHSEAYAPLKIRNAVVPVVNFASRISLPLFFLGAFFITPDTHIGAIIMNIAILMFSSVALFQLITLPVEFDASKRAAHMLLANYCIDEEEVGGVKKVLNAAALTYVAAALSSLLTLFRFFFLTRGRGRR